MSQKSIPLQDGWSNVLLRHHFFSQGGYDLLLIHQKLIWGVLEPQNSLQLIDSYYGVLLTRLQQNLLPPPPELLIFSFRSKKSFQELSSCDWLDQPFHWLRQFYCLFLIIYIQKWLHFGPIVSKFFSCAASVTNFLIP